MCHLPLFLSLRQLCVPEGEEMILYILVLLRQCLTVWPRLASNSSSPCLSLLITGLKKEASMPDFNISIVTQNQWRCFKHPLLDPGL